MDEFLKYFRSLPQALDQKEQEFLFYEYAKTKDPKIRERLITHNLRLCADYALKYCKRHNITWRIDEINSDCIIALVRAVDKYDISKGLAFSTFVWAGMSSILLNNYLKFDEDSLNHLNSDEILDKEYDEVNEGMFTFLYDQKESSFTEEVAGNEFVRDVLNYIDSWDNEKHSQITKMYFGLDGYKKYNQVEISNILNTNQASVSRILPHCKNLIKKFIAEKYPLSYPDIWEEISNQKEFNTIEERNNYIVKRYCGIDCDRLNPSQIAGELNVSVAVIHSVIEHYKKLLSSEEKDKIETSNRNKKWNDESRRKIFDAYYGLNGYTVHTPEEIIELFKLNINNNSCSCRVAEIKKHMIEVGEYTSEEIEKMDNERNKILEKIRMERYAYLYYSFYGLNGYEKKTQIILSKETGLSRGNIPYYIKQYKQYLNKQKSEELAD